MSHPQKLTELPDLPSPIQAGDLAYVVRNNEDYKAPLGSASQADVGDFDAAGSAAAAQAASLPLAGTAADVDPAGTAIAAALAAKLGATAQAADVDPAGTAIAAALAAKADASAIPAVDGWTAAGETWTYASAGSFTVPGDVTTKYAKGDKLKLTQTSVKFFYVIGVTHAAGTSTVTITGGTDYTLANAAITSPHFSKAASPVGFPHWFAFSVGFTGFSSNPAGFQTRFAIVGQTCHVKFRGTASGTSNATTFTMTGAPVTAAAAPATFSWLGYFWGIDGGAAQTQWLVIDPGTTTFICAKNGNGSGWTNSGAKGIFVGELFYEF